MRPVGASIGLKSRVSTESREREGGGRKVNGGASAAADAQFAGPMPIEEGRVGVRLCVPNSPWDNLWRTR